MIRSPISPLPADPVGALLPQALQEGASRVLRPGVNRLSGNDLQAGGRDNGDEATTAPALLPGPPSVRSAQRQGDERLEVVGIGDLHERGGRLAVPGEAAHQPLDTLAAWFARTAASTWAKRDVFATHRGRDVV